MKKISRISMQSIIGMRLISKGSSSVRRRDRMGILLHQPFDDQLRDLLFEQQLIVVGLVLEIVVERQKGNRQTDPERRRHERLRDAGGELRGISERARERDFFKTLDHAEHHAE